MSNLASLFSVIARDGAPGPTPRYPNHGAEALEAAQAAGHEDAQDGGRSGFFLLRCYCPDCQREYDAAFERGVEQRR